MCGIGGFRRFGDTPISREAVETMLVGLQNRGNDATGMAIVKEGELSVFKGDLPAWSFLRDSGFEKWISEWLTPKTSIVILHTRAATKGSPRVFENNHPMYKNRCAVVHNGVIINDDTLFSSMNLKREAETDSDILRAILDENGLTKKGIRQLSRVTGSVAMAAVDQNDPERLLLVRSGSPLVLGCTEDMLVWASEKKYIHAAMRKTLTRFKTDFQSNLPPDFGWLTMQDNSAWLFNDTEKEWHDECKTYFSTYVEPRRHVYENYSERQDKWNEKERAKGKTDKKVTIIDTSALGDDNTPIRLKCPATACRAWNRLTKDPKIVVWETLRCCKCDELLLPKAGAHA